MNQDPFLIVCTASSGSTMLAIALNRHPELMCGPEISVLNKRSFFESFELTRKYFGKWVVNGIATDGQAEYPEFFFNHQSYGWESKQQLIDVLKKTQSHKEMLSAFFSRKLARFNKTRWGEKTGSNAYCINEILKIYPNSKIIHLLRNPNDVIKSMIREVQMNTTLLPTGFTILLLQSVREIQKTIYV